MVKRQGGGNAAGAVRMSNYPATATEHSSRLILHVEELARARWPDETRLYTYVNPRRVKGPHTGYCFKKAGWRLCGPRAKNC